MKLKEGAIGQCEAVPPTSRELDDHYSQLAQTPFVATREKVNSRSSYYAQVD